MWCGFGDFSIVLSILCVCGSGFIVVISSLFILDVMNELNVFLLLGMLSVE